MKKNLLTTKRSELLWESFQLSPLMIFWVQPDGNFLHVNPAVCQALGYGEEELYELGAKGILTDITEEQRQGLRQRLRTEKTISLRAKLRRKDGSLLPVAALMNHVPFAGVDVDCAFCRDITEELQHEVLLQRENERLRWEQETALSREGLGGEGLIIGKAKNLRKVIRLAKKAAPSTYPVLIEGESGVGKELLARFVHRNSQRAEQAFLAVNCGALEANLVRSRLFGHKKGAFTGAATDRTGAFSHADGGTLFLDEIGELPLDIQRMLLRVLENGTFTPLGSNKEQKVDVRIVAATNKDLKAEVKAKRFRLDLLHRLNVVLLTVPPLRKRSGDIALLVDHFLLAHNETAAFPLLPPTAEAVARLQKLPFPGNVRELRNVVRSAAVLHSSRRLQFPPELFQRPTPSFDPGFLTMEEMHRAHIVKALRHCFGKISGPNGAAELLGMKAQTLFSRMRKLGIGREDWVKEVGE